MVVVETDAVVEVPAQKQRLNVYTMMLILSFAFITTGKASFVLVSGLRPTLVFWSPYYSLVRDCSGHRSNPLSPR